VVGDLEQLIAIAAAELGSSKAAVAHYAENRPADLTPAEAIWDLLMDRKPQAFVGGRATLSYVGYAYRYACRRLPQAVGPLVLTHSERRLLQRTRRSLAHLCALHWPQVRHVAFSAECTPLTATFALRGGDVRGSAFCWHEGLERTAIYPLIRIAEYRAESPVTLISVLLHEEFHLAAAAQQPQADFGPIGWRLFEVAAELAEFVSALLAAGYPPSVDALVEYACESERDDLASIVKIVGGELSAVMPVVTALAVSAAEGDAALSALAGSRLERLVEALGVD
jgi:hypothetical protein